MAIATTATKILINASITNSETKNDKKPNRKGVTAASASLSQSSVFGRLQATAIKKAEKINKTTVIVKGNAIITL